MARRNRSSLYLGKLISGEWTGTMNLTEPQAGSDLGALRTRAVPAQDERWGEHYRISGQKIFITYGDHDLTDNIVHMVLARTPDAPPGSRGISLFLVPKFLPDSDGRPGERNDLQAAAGRGKARNPRVADLRHVVWRSMAMGPMGLKGARSAGALARKIVASNACSR